MTINPPPIQRFESKLVRMSDFGHEVREFVLQKPRNFVFESGQFITILFELNGQKYRRPYSIVSSPSEQYIRLCIKHISQGPGGLYLWNLKIGDEIKCIGPLGVFTVDDVKNPIVFISTGTGVAPFASAISSILESDPNRKVTLLCGYRYAPLYHDFFQELVKKHSHFTYIPSLTQPQAVWSGSIGRVQANLSTVFDANASYYVCGLYEMIKDVVSILSTQGIAKSNIHFERYD